MVSPAFRKNVTRLLFIFAVLTFATGRMRLFNIYRSPTMASIHHYSGLVLAIVGLTHMYLNRRPLMIAFGQSPKKPPVPSDS